MTKSIWVGMSGGVDSAVAAMLLKEGGHSVTGITLVLCADETADNAGSGAADARAVCDRLGIPHHILSLTDIFEQRVVAPFVNAYLNGQTPNPCVMCNRVIKFGAMLDYALAHGADALATGHYARTEYDAARNRYMLYTSDSPKDQSYFLYGLSQHQLSRAVFPLCGMEKAQVRAAAAEKGLPVASKSDSMDICFISGSGTQRGAHADFIEKRLGHPLPRGNFTDSEGNVLGQHKGIARYTVGQRKGLGIASERGLYVSRIDADSNRVVLGGEGVQNRGAVTLHQVNYIAWDGAPAAPVRVSVRIRYRAAPVPATLTPLTADTVRLDFDQPVRAAAPGQSAVFYDGGLIAGGGIIELTIDN